MVRRILVLMDNTKYSVVAGKYALELARAHDAQLTVIAATDEGAIEKRTRAMGIGTSYYAKKLRESQKTEVDAEADKVLTDFCKEASELGVATLDILTKEAPVSAIIEESKYHDLLVMGLRNGFGTDDRHEVLDELVHTGLIPTLAVTDSYRPIEHVVLLFDGSVQAAKAAHLFTISGLWPAATKAVLTMHDGDEAAAVTVNSELCHYLEAHGHHCRREVHLRSEIGLGEFAEESGADLFVMGAYGKSRVVNFFFGSMTTRMIETSKVNLFLHH